MAVAPSDEKSERNDLTLQGMYDVMKDWLREFSWSPDPESLIYLDEDKNRIRCYIYSYVNEYSIVALPASSENKSAYLGCVALSRKPRPGEWWARGRDLIDGEFSKENWDKILRAIVFYEALDPALSAEDRTLRRQKRAHTG